jgi:archaeal flagellin FlaB
VIPSVKNHVFLTLGILVLIVIAAGCTDEEVQAPPPAPADTVLPGQALVAIGDVTGDGIAGGTIDTITFTLGLAPGAGPVDLEKLSIYYADTIDTESLRPIRGFYGNPATEEWGILNITNQIGSANNRLEDKEQAIIRINPHAYLPPNRIVTIVVMSPKSTPLTIRRIAPPTIQAQNNILAPV